jgi:hypothetical protein
MRIYFTRHLLPLPSLLKHYGRLQTVRILLNLAVPINLGAGFLMAAHVPTLTHALRDSRHFSLATSGT